MNYSGFWRRVVASMIDAVLLVLLLILLVTLLIYVVFPISGIKNQQFGALVIYLMWFFIVSIYFIGFWSLRGRTPGKMVMGIEIVRSGNESIGFGIAVLRYIYLIAPFLIILLLSIILALFIGVIAFGYLLYLGFPATPILIIIPLFYIIFDRENRGLHDILARTFVVKKSV